MNHPKPLLRWLGFLLLLSLFFISAATTARGASQVTLTKMEKRELVSSTRITFSFSALPNFELDHSGQRVDLLLTEAQVSPKLHRLPEDETVVKILLAQKHQDLLVSTLLRRPPKRVATETLQNPARVILDIFWQGDDGARPGVVFHIADMPPRKTSRKAQEFSRESPWDGHWYDFYRDYRSYWRLQLPVNFTAPLLSPLITDEQSPLWTLQQFAVNQQWLSLLHSAEQVSGLGDEDYYLYRLLIAEAQVRAGQMEAGLRRLEDLRAEEGPQQTRVVYLTASAYAASRQPFMAQLALQELLTDLDPTHPLAAQIHLLAAEVALETKQDSLALQSLTVQDLSWPDELLAIRDLRRADAKAGTGEEAAALDIYQGLLEEPKLFDHYLFSCNRAGFQAFKRGDYALARQFFQHLSPLLKEQPGASLAQYALGASAYLSGDQEWGLIGLQKAHLEHPDSEGGARAQLLLIDHNLLTNGELGLAEAIRDYARLSRTAGQRQVRDEATFKQALAQYLLGEHAESVQLLMRFRREYAGSPLRREADLLLHEQIPGVFEDLLAQQKELEAVVLVEQNRRLLLRDGFSRDFLDHLAEAFERLGLYDRATRVWLYMFDRTENENLQRELYLPLVRNYLKREEFVAAADYAGRYLDSYPHGRDAGAIFALLLDSFEAQGRHDKMLDWLERKDRPTSPELEVRAAWIFWQQERPEDVIERLELLRRQGYDLEVKEMALLAESYYRLKRNQAAEKIYRQLQDDSVYGVQARYRSAQLLLRKGERRNAVKVLDRLVEEDSASAWGKLARDLLSQVEQ